VCVPYCGMTGTRERRWEEDGGGGGRGRNLKDLRLIETPSNQPANCGHVMDNRDMYCRIGVFIIGLVRSIPHV
jgi:hypothetical protein